MVDFFGLHASLSHEHRRVVDVTRHFMESEIRPLANEFWERGEFPKHAIPRYGRWMTEIFRGELPSFPHPDPLLMGLVAFEQGRVDPSMTAFFGVHFGLCMATVAQFGSEAQRRRWLGALQRFEMVGAWAMTEPGVGSDAAAGIATTARRHGRDWVLNGRKSWVGNAPFADLIVVFARDEQDGAVKAFLVESDTPGLHIDKMQGKIALRTLENGAISLHDCIVSNSARLPGIQSFDDLRPVLTESRVLVAWEAAGIGQGAYEAALAYAGVRQQFGKPIAAFQLIQEKLVKMLAANIAMQSLLVRLAQLGAGAGGVISAERAALAKYFCAQQMRETVALAREVHGVNGILLDHNVARLFADAEAVFSYEGTQEMNLLIVGKTLTGISAFV